MNKVQIIGRLTRDVAVNEKRASFSVAVNGYNDRVDFLNVVAWEKRAEVASKYLKKGDRVGVTGRLSSRQYDADDGSKRTVIEIVAEELDFLTPKSEDENGETRGRAEPTEDDDLPF